MKQLPTQSKLSVDEIKRLYQLKGGGAIPDDKLRYRQANLTPAAQFVLRESRKSMGNYSPSSGIAGVGESSLLNDQSLNEVVQNVEKAEGETLTPRERTNVVAALTDSLKNYGVLQHLLNRPEINDIIVRAYNDVSVQIGRRNVQTDVSFVNEVSYKAFVEGLLKRVGKACTVASPIVDAALEPHIRVSVVHESISVDGSGPMLTLRISRYKKIDLEGLILSKQAPRAIFEYLAAVVKIGDGALLIAGEVGTGKTTLVRGLAMSLKEEDALLVIEDTNEIQLSRRFTRTILTRERNLEGAGEVAPADAIRAGMRMAMNRIILGEIRDGKAAEAFIDVCASGHPGMSTIHAKSARDALVRLELFLNRAQPEAGTDSIRRQIANAITVVVFLGIASDGSRKIMSVYEVIDAPDGVVQMAPIFEYAIDSKLVGWRRSNSVSKYQEELCQSGYVLPVPGSNLYSDGV